MSEIWKVCFDILTSQISYSRWVENWFLKAVFSPVKKPVVYSKESIILKLLEKHLLGILARSTEFLAHMNTLLIWQAWCRHNTHRNVCLGHIKWRVKEVSSSLKSKQKNYTIVCLHIQLPSTRERNKKKICHVVVFLGPSPFLLGFQVEI